uniref:Reverse transcriptase domain-containing protein n=1 Tax=Davidia involucrata TaxID=16924 RepID=A0A5B7B5L4_DAVIN
MNSQLIAPPIDEEIKVVAFHIHPSKSPGPDGMTTAFFQKYWHIVGKEVTDAVKTFFHTGSLLRSINFTNIALIHKISCPMSMGHLRPISLCNVSYKIIAKTLTNRLRLVMPSIISLNQGAFVPGRLITDNVIIAQELFHSLKRHRRGNKYEMAIKLDMSKAYDRVEWSFLQVMMQKLGFVEKWISWIMECVSTVSYSIIINGECQGNISPSRGLRQGDPLSPYLYLICAEGFSSLLLTAEHHRAIEGLRVSRGGPSINHLLFADDSLLFCRASLTEGAHVRDLLQKYGAMSGQVINFEKSSIFFSKNTPPRFRRVISRQLQIFKVMDHDKYLGLPSIIGHSKKDLFSSIKERVASKV